MHELLAVFVRCRKRGGRRRRGDLGGHLQEWLRGGSKHGVQGSRQLPAVVAQRVAVAVGQLADQTVIAQKAQMPGDTRGELSIDETNPGASEVFVKVS
ncbi:MAG: hypothetical protein JXR37_36760 [Kiritimatiellae bacterium]|nr:hypothetical protein [Kiritimatiellia bacterium]